MGSQFPLLVGSTSSLHQNGNWFGPFVCCQSPPAWTLALLVHLYLSGLCWNILSESFTTKNLIFFQQKNPANGHQITWAAVNCFAEHSELALKGNCTSCSSSLACIYSQVIRQMNNEQRKYAYTLWGWVKTICSLRTETFLRLWKHAFLNIWTTPED